MNENQRLFAMEEKINQIEEHLELTCDALEYLATQMKDIKEVLERPGFGTPPSPFGSPAFFPLKSHKEDN